MKGLAMPLVFALTVMMSHKAAFSSGDAQVLHYEVRGAFGDHLLDYCYEVMSGAHWYEWASVRDASAVLAAYDGKAWSVGVYRREFGSGLLEVSLFTRQDSLGKRPKLVRTDDPSDQVFQPFGRSFYTYAPVDAVLNELGIENGDLRKLAKAARSLNMADGSLRGSRFDLSRPLKSSGKKWSVHGIMAPDGYPLSFEIEQSTTEPRLLKFRRAATDVGPWEVEARLDSQTLRRLSKKEYWDE